MSRRFCAECGKIGVPLEDNFCEDCYWKFNSMLSIKSNRLDIPYCLTCYAVKLPTGWTKSNDRDALPDVVGYGYMRNIHASIEVDIHFEGLISDINWINPNPEFFIQYSGSFSPNQEFDLHKELIEIEIKLNGGICTSCVRRKTGTHDVTVQLRAHQRSLTKSEIDKSTKIVFNIANELYNETSNAYISDIIENHGGVDFYLGNENIAVEFVSKLTKTWIGHKEKNFKLITEEKDNTRVYRTTYLYRIPNVKTDDFVVLNKTLYTVLGVTAHGVKIMDQKTRKITTKTNWMKLQKPDPTPYLIKKLIVSEDISANSYIAMDLSTFENEDIDFDTFSSKLPIGEEIELLVWNGMYYLNQL